MQESSTTMVHGKGTGSRVATRQPLIGRGWVSTFRRIPSGATVRLPRAKGSGSSG